MSFRSLLVHLDDDPRCDARVHLAARLAATHDSHLIGVSPTGRIELHAAGGGVSHAIATASAARAEAVQRASERAHQFRARCRAQGVASFEAGVYEGEHAAVVLLHAHCADLCLISQADPASASHHDDTRFVEQVLLRSARPTLVVPRAGRFDGVGANVLIAWDDSLGSARATADALPLLRDAGKVHLRIWRRDGEAAEAAIRERLEAVQRWLGRQGVRADAAVETTGGSAIGQTILERAAGLGADLIVMGTYGHSRWTERIVGGATRSALARSALPLLMSH